MKFAVGCLMLAVGLRAVDAHGNLSILKIGGKEQKVRSRIPRSGNDGVCANPPGCEAGFACTHCTLEKVLANEQIAPGKWWTGMPAAHWDNPNTWPQFECMSKKAYGEDGIAEVAHGDTVDSKIYVNADHSGIYQYQIACGENPKNEDFMNAAATDWLALHEDKEGVTLTNRVAGKTKAQTDDYIKATTCSAAACDYRMNRGIEPDGSAHCTGNPADCYVNDSFVIPTTCSGPAVLRWFWLSMEGTEVYANCVDLNVAGNVQTPTGPTDPPVVTAPETPPTNLGTCAFKTEECSATPNCCPAGHACYEKDEYWSACRPDCTPGVWDQDEAKFQTDWTCKLLGGDVSAPSTPSTPSSPSTPVAPPAGTPCEDSANTAKDCPDWAGAGECESNPDFMNNECKKSCGICGASSPSSPATPAQIPVQKAVPGDYPIEATTVFDGFVEGNIKFKQVYAGGPVHISLNLVKPGSQVKATADHDWHVHEFPESGSLSGCAKVGGHFNPDDIAEEGTKCGPFDQGECAPGELGLKHGTLFLSGTPNVREYTDNNLQLIGDTGIIGRSVVLHDENQGSPTLSCSEVRGSGGGEMSAATSRVPAFAVALTTVLALGAMLV